MSQTGQKWLQWPPGGLKHRNLEAYTSKTKNIHLFNNKSQLLFVITFPVTIKINPDITVYVLDIQTDVEM